MSEEVTVRFTRDGSIAELIAAEIGEARRSVDAALYRLTQPPLARALAEAAARGLEIRLVLDRGKFGETRRTRQLLAEHKLPFRLLSGRQGPDAKMHHKFAILDGRTALTGSYNWTAESEDLNFDNLMVLRDAGAIKEYTREFELLWAAAEKIKPAANE
jgi:phosphatidylserine/phosphatidylglycerophosphate/cardiolipin synthase-like enzyme